jgi:aminoglycoside 2'-N-acetyltransferase I
MSGASILRLDTAELGAREAELRAMFDEAWADEGGFDDVEWVHAIGGTHFVLEADGRVRSHVSVVDRSLEADGRPLRTGYVEAVATWRADRRRGYASALMREATAFVDERYELGALGTGLHRFYERCGWETWRGPLAVRTAEGPVPTPKEEGYVMIRRTPSSPPLDLGSTLTCDPRPGDVW